jgi:hypothetical protein
MFQLTQDEWENLTFQSGISNKQHGGRRFMPYAFTEQGILMFATDSITYSQQYAS